MQAFQACGFARAGRRGIRSTAHLAGERFGFAMAISLTHCLAGLLCGNREQRLHPDTPSTNPRWRNCEHKYKENSSQQQAWGTGRSEVKEEAGTAGGHERSPLPLACCEPSKRGAKATRPPWSPTTPGLPQRWFPARPLPVAQRRLQSRGVRCQSPAPTHRPGTYAGAHLSTKRG